MQICKSWSCLTWTVVFHGIDTGAHVANPDFREVMTSHQHLAKGTENIWPHKTSLKKKWGTSNHWQQQPVNSSVHNRTAVALFYCWTKITHWHTAVPQCTKSLRYSHVTAVMEDDRRFMDLNDTCITSCANGFCPILTRFKQLR